MWKKGLFFAVSALGLFAAAPAHAERFTYEAPAVSYRAPVGYHRRWMPRARFGFGWRPVAQPVYQQPIYQRDYFADQVRAELGNLEAEVRARVAAGQLDGNALTTMEAGRDDLQADLVDLSAKGYLTDADRGHVENDLRLLREKLGC
jgi:hypothetical protein